MLKKRILSYNIIKVSLTDEIEYESLCPQCYYKYKESYKEKKEIL